MNAWINKLMILLNPPDVPKENLRNKLTYNYTTYIELVDWRKHV